MGKRQTLSPEALALVTEFKRTGQFDSLRRSLFQDFKQSVSELLRAEHEFSVS